MFPQAPENNFFENSRRYSLVKVQGASYDDNRKRMLFSYLSPFIGSAEFHETVSEQK
jgi:hypothetical protein